MRKKKVLAQIAAAGVMSLALASAAFGADLGSFIASSPIASVIVPEAASSAVASVDLPDAASPAAAAATEHSFSATVSAVFAAITGGSNPSSVVGKSGDAPGQAVRSQHEGNAGISQSHEETPAGTDGTSGTRGGWGCGDTNHEHSGPAGRPGATPPPGCTR